MKQFLVKTALFVLVIATWLIVLVAGSEYLIKQRKDLLLKLNTDIETVFAGNSAVECAVDDNLIPGSVNIAQSGEAYLYSYAKLKALCNVNKQIKTVFLSFSFVDPLIEKEESWLYSDEFIIEKVQYYNYLLDAPEKSFIMRNNPKAYFKGLTRSVFNSLTSVIKSFTHESPGSQLPNFGGYKYLVRDKLGADPGEDAGNQPAIQKSYQQEKYLIMISEFCRENSIRLVLLNTPKHKSYYENVDEGILKIWYDARNLLEQDSLLDLSAYELPDSCFGDLSHLNYRGTRVFSHYLNETLNQNPEEN